MKKYIYADNAATTKLDEEAFEAMKPFLIDNFGNASQPYSFSRKNRYAIKQARERIADCIGAFPEEIIFTSGGSESNNWAIKCFGHSSDLRTVFVSDIEHHSVLNACKHQSKNNRIGLLSLPVDSYGIVHPVVLQKAMDDEVSGRAVASCETKLVSVMLANNEIGTIEPVRGLAETAHSKGALFHTDAVQAVGHIKIDVHELGVDMLSASAHKFNGPKGIGFLYIKKGTLLSQFIDGGSQEYGMRAGTENAASIVAMSVALKNNCDMMEENTAKMITLEKAFLYRLNAAHIDYIRNGNEKHIPGNVSVSINGQSGEMLLHRLDLMGICISTGSACDSKRTQISHVLKAIGLPDKYAEGTVRVSFGKHNTVEEAEYISDALIRIINREV